ncbi:AIM24 family protein [Brachybacterium sp. EF45031]|uniref:AIM24 family protein n=1 Tax=Brachybacterium sillae TaxID=2810536 RepID=UPI00217E1572|nr:AIM24 family protein [Brachybacterium sillae]MCS6711448.1 AIM24 family protein [Brachybacterium sillae]
MRSTLFDAANQEKQTTERWTLQSSKMLRCALGPQDPEIVASAGAMVAYQGNMQFEYQGSGGGMKLLKKLATGEGANLMRVRGHGEVFFARRAEDIFLLLLEGDALTLNTGNLLAFDSSISWDIRTLGGAGFMAGGLFNLLLQGQGLVAVTSDGPPMLLDCSQQPTYVDPQAAVCWSANLQPQIKNDFSIGSLIGRGSGESFQLAFHGPGFVVVQPSEGAPVVTASS